MHEGKSDDLMEAAIRAVDAAREDMLLAKASDNTYLLRKVAISVVHGALLAERRRCEEVARTWEQTAKKVGQIEGEGVARDIRLCIAAGIPAPPSSTEES